MIEKLGITPLEPNESARTPKYTCLYKTFSTEQVREVEQQRDEMLEALIVICSENINYETRHALGRIAVEKATGKSWEEIKEINND